MTAVGPQDDDFDEQLQRVLAEGESHAFAPASDVKVLLAHIDNRLQQQAGICRRIVGVVFARPSSPIVKSELLPQIADWHFRSADSIDFYFAGYAPPRPRGEGYIEVPIPGLDPWQYSPQRFDTFRRTLEAASKWRYSGSAELLLLTATRDPTSKRAVLDLSAAICCRLDEMKQDQAIVSIERFFESIIRLAEESNTERPIWSLSDKQGAVVAGSAIVDSVLALLPKPVQSAYKRAKSFAVLDVSR